MPANPMSRGSLEWLGAGSKAATITPHASNEFMPTVRIICAAAGTVACRFANDNTDVSLTLLAGVEYKFSIKAVRITGTTATGIVGIY